MKNIRLNPGGVIGAVFMLAAVSAFVLLTSSLDNVGSRAGGLGVLGVFVGAFGGNYLWERWFPKSK